MSASSASSVHLRSLHPLLHPLLPSCPSLFFPAAGQFLPQQRKTSLIIRLRHQCVLKLRTESLSKLPMNSHLLSPLSFSHIVLSVLPSLCSFLSTFSFSSSSSSHYPLVSSLFIVTFFSLHPLRLPTLLFPSLAPAVTPVSGLFGPVFQSSLN